MTLIKEKNICVIIPARIQSSRFPGKVLWKFLDRPMIEHVYRRACLAIDPQNIYVASGDPEILNHIKSIGGNVFLTHRQHNDGTSRAAEVAEILTNDFLIILQADEILIDPEHLREFANKIVLNPNTKFWNLITQLKSDSELDDTSIVKCALNDKNEILFMFRRNPFINSNYKTFFKVMGTMGYHRKSLLEICHLPDTPLQIANSTEQLKILEKGFCLNAFQVDDGYPSINVPGDIDEVSRYIKNHSKQNKIINEYVKP